MNIVCFHKQTIKLSYIFILLCLLASNLIPVQTAKAEHSFSPPNRVYTFPSAFNKNHVLEDSDFSADMAESEIQAFLTDKGSFFATYQDPAGHGSAAHVFWQLAHDNGISPRVLLVTAQKESSSISSYNNMNATQYDNNGSPTAPDGTPYGTKADWFLFCGWTESRVLTQYKGFYNQIRCAAAEVLGKPFHTGVKANGKRVGDSEAVDSQTVTYENAATLALYNYTPHIGSPDNPVAQYGFFTHWTSYLSNPHFSAQNPPCPQSGGVILYWNADKNCDNTNNDPGYRQLTSPGTYGDFGNFNDKASSIEIPAGWSVKLSNDADGRNGSICFNSSIADFGTQGNYPDTNTAINDSVSRAEVFDHTNCPNTTVDDATFVSQSGYPTVAPNQSFQIYFTVKNTGTSTWQPGSYWLQNQQSSLGANPQQALSQSVAPNGTYTWTINETAPASAGTYRSAWMVNHNGTNFGPYMYMDVTVQSDAGPHTPSNPNPADGAIVDRTTDITFSWNTDGTSCEIHISGGPNINTTDGTSCSSFPWGSHWPGQYQWQITAHKNSLTTLGPTWTLKIRPSPPTNLTASVASCTSINLSWTKSSDDPGSVDSYNVYDSNSNGTPKTSLNAGSTNYSVGGLTGSTSYTFYVTAVRQGVESNASSPASATTPACLTPSPTSSTPSPTSPPSTVTPATPSPTLTNTPATPTTTATQPPRVSTTLNVPSINPGDTAVVSVSLLNVPADGYASGEFTCESNPPLVASSDVSFASLFGPNPVTVVTAPQNGKTVIAIAGSRDNKATTSGPVFRFNVKGLQAGQTQIECTARVSKGDNVAVSLPSSGALLTIAPLALLTGQVNASKPVTINVFNANNVLVASLPTNPDGTFGVSTSTGNYTVIATASGSLRAQGSIALTFGATSSLPRVTLPAGDIDGNNVINAFDALTIGMNYGIATPAAADLNNDLVIDFLDLELLARNYLMTGPIPWQ